MLWESRMRLLPTVPRTYATKAPGKHSIRLSPRKPPLSLDHFLIRQRVLALYRSIMRACFKIPPPTREEMKAYAREEFGRHRDVEDLRKIRYLLSTGKAELDKLRGQIGGMTWCWIYGSAGKRKATQYDVLSGHRKEPECDNTWGLVVG